jgi:hypothetical protein
MTAIFVATSVTKQVGTKRKVIKQSVIQVAMKVNVVTRMTENHIDNSFCSRWK